MTKTLVIFAIEKSGMLIDVKPEKIEDRIVSRINSEISDVADTTREILDKLSDRENRIRKLEVKTVRAKAV